MGSPSCHLSATSSILLGYVGNHSLPRSGVYSLPRSGTQAFVHLQCLFAWQQSPIAGGDRASRRSMCPVCRHLYQREFQVEIQRSPWMCKATAVDGMEGGAAAAPRWSFPQQLLLILAVLPLLCLGADLEWQHAALIVGGGAALFTGLRAATSWLCRAVGVRFTFVVDEDGPPILRLVRVGSPVRGLAAGALLVATERVGGGFFERTVIVLTRHDHTGSIGYVVNLPMHAPSVPFLAARYAGGFGFEDGPPLGHALALPEAPEAVWHGLGGPVGMSTMPSATLHRFGRRAHPAPGDEPVPGATPLVEGTAPAASTVFVGGDLITLHARARAAAAAAAAAASKPTATADPAWEEEEEENEENDGGAAAGGRGGVGGLQLRVLHGYASWAPGQLEGEIEAKVWAWASGLGADVALEGAPRTAEGRDAQPHEERDLIWERALRRVAEARSHEAH
jgi:hypothetical protein